LQTFVAVLVTGITAFAGGALAMGAAVLAAGGLFLSQGGFAFGGALDPITGSIALGLGGLALARKMRQTEEPELA